MTDFCDPRAAFHALGPIELDLDQLSLGDALLTTVTRCRVREQLTTRLTSLGISVVAHHDRTTPATGTLSVRSGWHDITPDGPDEISLDGVPPAGIGSGDGLVLLVLQTTLWRPVLVAALPPLQTRAPLWTGDSCGMCHREDLSERVVQDLEQVLDGLAQDYQATMQEALGRATG